MVVSKFSQDCNRGVSQAAFSPGDLNREESASTLTQVGKIHFHAVVGLRGQLLVGCQVKGPPLLEPACSSYRLSTNPSQAGLSNMVTHFIKPAARMTKQGLLVR